MTVAKSCLGILVSVLVSACAVRVSRGEALPDRDVALRELMRIEDEIGRANRECDYKYFREIEAPEFIFTGANGAVTTRDEDLAGEKDCRRGTFAQTIDEPRLQIHGNVAVLSARSSIESIGPDGKTVTRRTRFTDVFVWRDGRWQLVSGHSSRIPG